MNRIVYIGLVVCSLVFGGYAQAQTLRVVDEGSGQALELATVSSESGKLVVVTDPLGQATLGSTWSQLTDIVVRLLGYQEQVVSYAQLQAAGFVLKLQPSRFSLDQVVVSASRWDENKRYTPLRIASISSQEVQLQNPQTAADMLALSGQVFIQKSQLGGGSPMIRGFATNRVLLVVDGVRMNTAIFRGGNLQNVISLDPFAISRTEVVFGPGSVIYGSDAIGGVMSFSTLAPELRTGGFGLSGSASARYATANQEKTAHLHLGGGSRKWAFLTSATVSDFGDLRMGSNGPDDYLRPEYVERINGKDSVVTNSDPLVQNPTGYRQYNVMQQLRFRPNDRWNFRYAFHYSTTTDYSRYDRLLLYRNGKPRSAEWYYGPQQWMMNHLSVNHTGTSRLFDQLNINLAHQQFGESRHDRNLNSSTLRNRSESVQALSANVDLVKRWDAQRRLSYGVEAIVNKVNSEGDDENITTGVSVPASSRYPDGARWHSLAAYASYLYQPTAAWSLQAGMRYNNTGLQAQFSTDFFPFPFSEANLQAGALTGSLGAVYNSANNWQWRIHVATGFRAPNVDDVGKVFDSTPGSVVVPNPNLKPEYIYSGELGLAKLLGERLKFDVSLYYSLLDQALVRRAFALNGQDSIVYDGELSRVEAIQNAAQATVYGVQAGIEVKLAKGLVLSSRFNYQQGEEELDNGTVAPLRHAAPWFGATHLLFERGKLQLDAYTLYNGAIDFEELAPEEQGKPYLYAKDEAGQPYCPGWYTLNLKAMLRLTDAFSFSVGVENITDQRYRPYSSGVTAAGRNLVASAKASF